MADWTVKEAKKAGTCSLEMFSSSCYPSKTKESAKSGFRVAFKPLQKLQLNPWSPVTSENVGVVGSDVPLKSRLDG